MTVRHEYDPSSSSVLDAWTGDYSGDSFPDESSWDLKQLANGETIVSLSKANLIINNTFTKNLRGQQSAVIYMERSPFTLIEGNSFIQNIDSVVLNFLESLD